MKTHPKPGALARAIEIHLHHTSVIKTVLTKLFSDAERELQDGHGSSQHHCAFDLYLSFFSSMPSYRSVRVLSFPSHATASDIADHHIDRYTSESSRRHASYIDLATLLLPEQVKRYMIIDVGCGRSKLKKEVLTMLSDIRLYQLRVRDFNRGYLAAMSECRDEVRENGHVLNAAPSSFTRFIGMLDYYSHEKSIEDPVMYLSLNSGCPTFVKDGTEGAYEVLHLKGLSDNLKHFLTPSYISQCVDAGNRRPLHHSTRGGKISLHCLKSNLKRLPFTGTLPKWFEHRKSVYIHPETRLVIHVGKITSTVIGRLLKSDGVSVCPISPAERESVSKMFPKMVTVDERCVERVEPVQVAIPCTPPKVTVKPPPLRAIIFKGKLPKEYDVAYFVPSHKLVVAFLSSEYRIRVAIGRADDQHGEVQLLNDSDISLALSLGCEVDSRCVSPNSDYAKAECERERRLDALLGIRLP